MCGRKGGGWGLPHPQQAVVERVFFGKGRMELMLALFFSSNELRASRIPGRKPHLTLGTLGTEAFPRFLHLPQYVLFSKLLSLVPPPSFTNHHHQVSEPQTAAKAFRQPSGPPTPLPRSARERCASCTAAHGQAVLTNAARSENTNDGGPSRTTRTKVLHFIMFCFLLRIP